MEHKISPNKPIRDVKETEAHAKVFFEMLRIKQELTKQILLNWHKEIFSETKPDIAGKFRDYLVRIGDHLATDWQDVEALMLDLMRQIDNKPKGEEIIKFAAAIHYRFEKIHPFGDGNGRIGRLILNFLIWHAGYPMLIVTYKKRKSYNNAFKKDEENFIKYFLRYYLSIHKKRYLKSTS